MAAIPVGEMRYRSSEPTEIPATRFVKSVPYVEIEVLRAAISALIPSCPPEAQRPRRREVPSVMAAGMASVGWLVELPPC